MCIWGGRDKENGLKLFLLKPLLKVNNSNNCTITDNYYNIYTTLYGKKSIIILLSIAAQILSMVPVNF